MMGLEELQEPKGTEVRRQGSFIEEQSNLAVGYQRWHESKLVTPF